MSIKRYVANQDTTITNAYQENYRTLGVNANMGEADSLEIFSLYKQVGTSSLEKSRILVQFPINEIVQQRSAGVLPSAGSVDFYLRLFNVKHSFSVPRKFWVTINPVSRSWEEGYGLDMESYADLGFVENVGGYGTTWLYAASGSKWNNEGSDITNSYEYTYYFETGLEDIELNITDLVEAWADGSQENNGLLIKLSGSYEDGTQLTSFYTKKFSARGSEFYFGRPCIEARWSPIVVDDRNQFRAYSPLLSDEDNTMNLYFYNRVGGILKNVQTPLPLNIEFYTDSSYTNQIYPIYSSVTNPLPGVYRAEVRIDTSASVLYDKWVNVEFPEVKYFSGSFDVYQHEADTDGSVPEYIVNITNLKQSYSQQERARLNIFVRERGWQPTIYTVAYKNIENTSIPNLYYKIFRLNDNYVIVDYSTGSLAYSKTSYDSNGNYFELDMNIFEKDYGYGIKLATWDSNELKEFKDTFKFRIV